MQTGMFEVRPLVSVIFPIYIVGAYLRQCILSICSQSYEKLQIILVDDGSTDDSPAVCREFAETDSRVILVRKENGGLVSARKAGMRAASGLYVSFVDGDDWIDPDMYEQLMGQAAEHSYPDIIAFGHIEEHESFSVKVGNRFAEGLWNISQDGLHAEEALMTESFFQWKILPNLCNKLIRADILSEELDKVSGKIVFGEDAACTYPCIKAAASLLNIRYSPYHYRQRLGSIVKSGEEQSRDNFREIYKRLRDVLSDSQLRQYLFFILLLKGYTKIGSGLTLFPFQEVKPGSRVFVYGAGGFGKVLHEYITGHSELRLAGWTDREYLRYRSQAYEIDDFDTVFSSAYDYLIIAILNEETCGKIRQSLKAGGIPEHKILHLSYALIDRQKLPGWIVEEPEEQIGFSDWGV